MKLNLLLKGLHTLKKCALIITAFPFNDTITSSNEFVYRRQPSYQERL